MPSVLPPEIEETILDLLAEDDNGHSALKTCSLVCHAFLPICRKHIFGSIVLNDQDVLSSPTPHPFERLLHETPEIADYIRKLDYIIRFARLTSPSIQESLKRISRLEFLTVCCRMNWIKLDWRNNPIRPALLHLLHLPTLTHFKVSNVNNFVISDLISCVNLKYLDIGVFTTVAAENAFPAAFPEHSIQPNEFIAGSGTSTVIMKLCTTRRPDGQPIIDFGSLSKITLDIQEPNEGEASQELFRRCHVLTNVNIFFRDPRNVRPSLADMLRPSMQTLKHLVVNIIVDDVDVDPLIGIPSELEEMRTKNIVETVHITIVDRSRTSCRQGDEWGRLDEVLTTPGWFLLKRVSLTIEIAGYLRRYEDGDELEVTLRNLPETHFPRLSLTNSVPFDFEIIRVQQNLSKSSR